MNDSAKYDRPRNSDDPAELRRRAEMRLSGHQTQTSPNRTHTDSERQIHELEVHQIELEMQNEELGRARQEMEALLEKYTDLYDFAPVGYLILDREGVISEAFRARYLSDPADPEAFEGRAVVFDGPEDYHAHIDDEPSCKTTRSIPAMVTDRVVRL